MTLNEAIAFYEGSAINDHTGKILIRVCDGVVSIAEVFCYELHLTTCPVGEFMAWMENAMKKQQQSKKGMERCWAIEATMPSGAGAISTPMPIPPSPSDN